MENHAPQKVFLLSPESLSDGIKMCTTLPQYHILICADSLRSKADLLDSISSLFFGRPEDTISMKARVGGARIAHDFWSNEAHIEFWNRSQILFCTNLEMNKYAEQNIQSVLIYDKIQYIEAAMEYAKTIVKPYEVHTDYDLSDDIYPIKRHDVDTSAMDNFLEEI